MTPGPVFSFHVGWRPSSAFRRPDGGPGPETGAKESSEGRRRPSTRALISWSSRPSCRGAHREEPRLGRNNSIPSFPVVNRGPGSLPAGGAESWNDHPGQKSGVSGELIYRGDMPPLEKGNRLVPATVWSLRLESQAPSLLREALPRRRADTPAEACLHAVSPTARGSPF